MILKSSKIRKVLKTGDYILISLLCIIITVLFLPSFFSSQEKLQAEISFDGKVEVYDLSSLEKDITVKVGGCEIFLEKDGASFLKSGCTDSLCIKRGKLKKSGDSMACVPEKVVVTIKGEKKQSFHISTY